MQSLAQVLQSAVNNADKSNAAPSVITANENKPVNTESAGLDSRHGMQTWDEA